MARHTSWRIGGPADYFCVVEEEQQLFEAVSIAKSAGIPWLVLGGGNNILVSDDGVEGLVILNRLRGLAIEDGPTLACAAGVFFAKAAQFTARQGFTGMEWGISIPGTVGAGVVNNAGAHWSDVSQALVSADVVDDKGESRRLTPKMLLYRYRQSALKRPHLIQSTFVVTSCRFRLAPTEPRAALARLEEFRQHRQETQPIKEPSAGSTFKNPPGGHAGALIDRAGLKGR
ncbi:MAG TPA: UDP-N-acetylmuramate dehydrogenase, partial [Chloroflexota bacterium]